MTAARRSWWRWAARDRDGRRPRAVPPREPERVTRSPWPALAALLTWLVGLPFAHWWVSQTALDPFTIAATVLPAGVTLTAGLVCVGLWSWLRRDVIAGVGAGVVATGSALVLWQILAGSPFAPGGLVGDVGRYTALATRYTVTTTSADAVIPGAPAEYPPLIPWLIGRAAVLLDVPAWQLLAPAVVILTSGTVVLTFWLWNRVVHAGVALALASLPLAVFSSPTKSFHLLALAMLAPWAVVSLAGLRRESGGLHWTVAGLLGGFMVLVYPGYLVFASIGIVALVVLTWWRSEQRTRYVLHLVGVGATALVCVSWWVLPFFARRQGFSTGSVSDQFDTLSNYYDPAHLPPTVLDSATTGIALLLGLWVLGAVGLAWWASRGRTWAVVMAAVVLGAVVYRTAQLLRYVESGQTGFLQYANRLIDMVLVAAGVLTLAAGLPALRRVATRSIPVAVPTVLVALAASYGVVAYLDANRLPVEGEQGSLSSLQAQIEPLPDCSLPQYSPRPAAGEPPPTSGSRTATLLFRPVACFPAAAVRAAVEDELGPWALPVTLSYSERLWAFYPWYAYATVDRMAAGLYQNYDARVAELARLATISSSGQLAAALADTPFGPLDVLVLRSAGREALTWTGGGDGARSLRFTRQQFLQPWFLVVDVSPSTTVVIRRTAQVPHVPYPV